MNKYNIEYNISVNKLNINDVIVLSRHSSLGYGEHYYNIAVVKSINENIIADLITYDTETNDLDNFLETCYITSYNYDNINLTKEHINKIHRIPTDVIINQIQKQILINNNKISDLEINNTRLLNKLTSYSNLEEFMNDDNDDFNQ